MWFKAKMDHKMRQISSTGRERMEPDMILHFSTITGILHVCRTILMTNKHSMKLKITRSGLGGEPITPTPSASRLLDTQANARSTTANARSTTNQRFK
mmetsp:Transcript_61227/g.138474  ORF Transcript_61227/g.138474 Transcript_61227/m.138474 type:complete len:98 (+) Transcript_61227:2014-2307(+)